MNTYRNIIRGAVAAIIVAVIFSACSSSMERDAKRVAKRAIEFQQLQQRYGDRSNLFGKPLSSQEMEQETREYIDFVNNILQKYSESIEVRQEFNDMVNKEIRRMNGGSDVNNPFGQTNSTKARAGGLNAQTRPNANRNVKQNDEKGYVDLGLSSGTLWKNSNENGLYDFDDAKSRFGNSLPTKRQMDELTNQCRWTKKSNGFTVVGPNGNSIFIPNNGFYDCEGTYSNYDGIQIWSSSLDEDFWAWCLSCNSDVVSVTNEGRCCKFAVRLVKRR